MLTKILTYLPAIIGVFSIGVFVLANNAKTLQNRFFAVANFLTGFWLFFLMLADLTTNDSLALIFTRLGLFCGQLMLLFFYFFALQFPYKSKYSKTRQTLYAIPMILLSILMLTPLGVIAVETGSAGAEIVSTGAVYTVADAFTVGYLLLTVVVSLRKYKKSKADQKQQIKYLLIGLGIAGIANFVANIVLVKLWGGTTVFTDFLSSFSIVIFSAFVAYAIVKHKLFDIRVFVAKAVAYTLSLGLLTAFFVTITLLISQFFAGGRVPTGTLFVFALVSIFAAVAFQPIKKFFDKVTNRFFYRDAYDGQALLNKLNSSLVSNANIEPMLNDASIIVAENLRPDFCAFALTGAETGKNYVNGTKVIRATDSEVRIVSEMTESQDKTIATGDLEGHREAKSVLNKYRVELTTKLVVGDQTIGYLMLGVRKSGSHYSQRDIQLLETVADSVAIAAQNALRFEEIAQFNVELEKKIEDATGKLQKSNEKLKALDEAKDEFISMASHQLRTPLTSVKGYISMILEGDAGPVNEQQKLFLDQAFISSQRMVYLIADLLNVSRLKTGKFIIEPKPTYLPDVIESEISQLYETAKARELKLVFNKPKEFPTLNLDEVKTRQVIMNFTDNAIYYTPKGGKIALNLKATKDSIEFTVHDTGIGVPKHEQHHLFTKFYRAGNARKARPDGTGLGLFMGKKVIVAQGGAILFSTEEGKGSTFGFTFPRAKLETESVAPKK